MNDVKPWYRSKVIWINLATLAGAVVTLAADSFPTLKPFLPANVYAFVAWALPLANIALRFVTSASIGKT